MSSNFSYLKKEFPILYNLGRAAEYNLHDDPDTSVYKLRKFGERISVTLFQLHHLELPYDNTFHNRLRELEYDNILPANIKDLLHGIRRQTNDDVHDIQALGKSAKTVLMSTFKVGKWFYMTYSVDQESIADLKFSMPEKETFVSVSETPATYKSKDDEVEIAEEYDTSELSTEIKQEFQSKSEKAAQKIDLSEAETRNLIDAQLRQVGWEVDSNRLNWKEQKTVPVHGKNRAIAEWPCQGKWADYALFIGTELYGIVEAKKYAADISTNLAQSKTYAELVNEEHEASLLGKWANYKVPFLFSTNGRPYLQQLETKSGVWFLDVRQQFNASKALKGWYSPQGLQKLFEKDLKNAEERLRTESAAFLKNELRLRDYQLKAVEAVEKQLLDQPEKNRALLAMATGTGKTRTIIGLCYRLIQTNRFHRVLFLVDRTLLAIQAINAFKDNKVMGINTFADIYDIKELKDLSPDLDTRLHFATVQGMVKRIFYSEEEEIPPVDQYDCIIIDEAHRGYLMDREMDDEELGFKNQMDYVSKYRMVLDYFDAFAVGLTATPALHTKEIFGSPAFTYSYREAVIDGFLIDHEPPYKVKTKLGEEGIKWEAGEKPKVLDLETNEIRALEELEDELKIEIANFNKKVITENFNRTVIQALIEELDPDGDEKTLVFAATDEHADLVVQLFKEEFEKMGVPVSDDMIQKITGNSYDPKEQLRRYKNEKYPNIAVTVDLLTTGIDVPSICNLVFLRRIKSRILYEQMLGRATRRCDEIGKEVFKIFDAVKIYETLEPFTQMKPVVPTPSTTFQQLAQEMEDIKSDERVQKQVEQIIAKLRRKRQQFSEDDLVKFEHLTGGNDPDQLAESLLENQDSSREVIKQLNELWKYLDEYKRPKDYALVSEHEDELIQIDRGYGKAKKPEDYLESFEQYIRENQNKIQALRIIVTKPSELDRASLKSLLLDLDQHGFNTPSLQTAWKAAKNEDIAADIISYIRTLTLGSSLISHEQRIKNAVDHIRGMKSWNKLQTKWIDRFEAQLLRELILQKEDLDKEPFRENGGWERLNKIFDDDLGTVIDELNNKLYLDIA